MWPFLKALEDGDNLTYFWLLKNLHFKVQNLVWYKHEIMQFWGRRHPKPWVEVVFPKSSVCSLFLLEAYPVTIWKKSNSFSHIDKH